MNIYADSEIRPSTSSLTRPIFSIFSIFSTSLLYVAVVPAVDHLIATTTATSSVLRLSLSLAPTVTMHRRSASRHRRNTITESSKSSLHSVEPQIFVRAQNAHDPGPLPSDHHFTRIFRTPALRIRDSWDAFLSRV